MVYTSKGHIHLKCLLVSTRVLFQFICSLPSLDIVLGISLLVNVFSTRRSVRPPCQGQSEDIFGDALPRLRGILLLVMPFCPFLIIWLRKLRGGIGFIGVIVFC